MLTSGPEGEQDVRDSKGKPVKSSMSVKFIGFKQYIRELEDKAGLIDKDVEELVEKWKDEEEKMAALERRMGVITS